MDITGKIKVINDEQSFASGFTKREFVITTEEQYPQDILFSLVKDKTSLINAYQVGDRLKVHFNLRGREYNGKYYVNLEAWRLEAGDGATAAAPRSAQSAPPPPPPPASTDYGDSDDLPF